MRRPYWLAAAIALTIALGGLTPSSSSGQTIIWREVSTLGYGVTGGVLGLVACWSCSYDAFPIVVLVSGVTGFVAGNHIGGSAERAARTGSLTAPQRWGARFGMVTGFASVGTLLAAHTINTQEGNAPGEDERRLRDYTLVGAGVGVLAAWLQESALSRRAVSVSLSATPEADAVVGLRLRAPNW